MKKIYDDFCTRHATSAENALSAIQPPLIEDHTWIVFGGYVFFYCKWPSITL